MSLFIPWFINTGVILVMFGVLVALLLAIDNRFREVADRIDPAFSKTWDPGTSLIPDIFMGTYMVAFICMMFVAEIIALVLSPVIASGFPSSPIPAVLDFPFYYLCFALLSAPGFVWLTIRRGD